MDYDAPKNNSNAMGLIGFIVSLVSLVGCGGFLSPVSLVFSLIGLGKQPKGFAIAGLVLSLVGLVMAVLTVLFFGVILAAIGLGILAAGIALVAADGQNAIEIVTSVHEYHDTNSVVPASLDELNLQPGQLTDTWGNEFVYVPATDGHAYLLISAGPDGIIANNDDLLGEISYADSDFNFQLHHGYSDINSAQWGGLPQPVAAHAMPVVLEDATPDQPTDAP